MKQLVSTIILSALCIVAAAQEADYVIDGVKDEPITLSVSGFADEDKSTLSVVKVEGDDDEYNVSGLQDGKVKFVFNEPKEYMFDFWEDYNGCRYNTRVLFHIETETVLYVPNIFTPNGDGINDHYHITYNYRPATFDIVIYNREGRKMYSSTDPDFRWDGSRCTPGVYSYLITYTTLGKHKTEKGHITVNF
ncbi:MAG: gliding motility-associated C-terminal domain-containing protein [Bacteroidales bacterium]|nr:gliding motility-associated C-terminal domain-containing protein [Bacteroidales bacterium]